MTTANYELKIVGVGQVNTEVLDYLAFVMSGSLGLRSTILDVPIDARAAYNSKRRQYDSSQILKQLLGLDVGEDCKILGVADVDLCVPIFTFVFGSAQVGGKAALISVSRLHQQFYGLPEDKNLFLLRCEKEAAHELGHAFGLVHCPSYECVMHFSNSIEQVDLKSPTFCGSCQMLLPAKVESAA